VLDTVSCPHKLPRVAPTVKTRWVMRTCSNSGGVLPMGRTREQALTTSIFHHNQDFGCHSIIICSCLYSWHNTHAVSSPLYTAHTRTVRVLSLARSPILTDSLRPTGMGLAETYCSTLFHTNFLDASINSMHGPRRILSTFAYGCYGDHLGCLYGIITLYITLYSNQSMACMIHGGNGSPYPYVC